MLFPKPPVKTTFHHVQKKYQKHQFKIAGNPKTTTCYNPLIP